MAFPNDPGSLDKLLGFSERFYSVMHANMTRWINLYERNFSMHFPLPQNIRVHESATPSILVDELRDQIRVDEPRVVAKIFGVSKTQIARKERQEMWAEYLMRQVAAQGLLDPYGQARHDLILTGAACIKWFVKKEVLEEPERLGNESEKDFKTREREWRQTLPRVTPYEVRPVDPRNIFVSPGTGRPLYILERQRRRVIDMMDSYPEWNDPKAKKLAKSQQNNPLREVEWLEYWSWGFDRDRQQWTGRYIVEADGHRIINKSNPYGHVPYSFRYSGLGRVDENSDPAALAIGVLNSISGELEAEVRVKTAMSAQWLFHVFPVLTVKGMTAAEARKSLQVGPGSIVELDAAQGEFKWLEQPQPNNAMLQYLAEIKQNINRKFAPVLSGQSTGEFAIKQALEIGQATKGIGPVKAALNRMAAESIEGMAMLMERFGLNMTVYGRGSRSTGKERLVKGSDFKQVEYEVTFETVDPEENDRRMLALLAVLRMPGIISRATFRRLVLPFIDSNDEEEAQLMAEQSQDILVQSGAFLPMVQQELAGLREATQLDEITGALERNVSGAMREVNSRERSLEGFAGGGTIPTETDDEVLSGT